MADIDRLVIAGIAVGLPKALGFGPVDEISLVGPGRVRGKQGVALFLVCLAAQQPELDEARNFRQAGIAISPDGFEFRLGADGYLTVAGPDEPDLKFPVQAPGIGDAEVLIVLLAAPAQEWS